MKDHLNLAIRVNIAVILAMEIMAALVLPILIAIILGTNIASSSPDAAIWLGITANAVIVFLAAFWVFKMTYENMLKTGKKVDLINSLVYSIILFVIVNVALSFILNRGHYIVIIVAAVVALIAFYLAGKKVDKKQPEKPSEG